MRLRFLQSVGRRGRQRPHPKLCVTVSHGNQSEEFSVWRNGSGMSLISPETVPRRRQDRSLHAETWFLGTPRKQQAQSGAEQGHFCYDPYPPAPGWAGANL